MVAGTGSLTWSRALSGPALKAWRFANLMVTPTITRGYIPYWMQCQHVVNHQLLHTSMAMAIDTSGSQLQRHLTPAATSSDRTGRDDTSYLENIGLSEIRVVLDTTHGDVSPHPSIPPQSPPSKLHSSKARLQFICLCWTLFLAGWNDGTTGPLLPRIQKVYNVRAALICLFDRKRCVLILFSHDEVGFDVVSLIFVIACIVSIRKTDASISIDDFRIQGFITGALINVPMSERFGFGKVRIMCFTKNNLNGPRN